MAINTPAQASDHPKIAVIGAGLAGLTFAYRLEQQGHDVTVFEARPRVGGRVKSAYVKNLDNDYSLIELGGQNIPDGGEGRYILALAKELGIEVVTQERSLSQVYYDGSQFYPVSQLITSEVNTLFADLQEQLKPLSQENLTVQALIDALFPNPLISIEQGLIKRLLSLYISSYEGAPLNQLSAHNNVDVITEVMQWPSNPQNSHLRMQFKKGASTLPMALAEYLGNRVHLNHVLKKVSMDGDQITLTFQDSKTITCDKLILAIPAPCYQDIQFSEAVLPEKQLSLIKKVPHGSNAKAVIPIQHAHLPYNLILTDNLAGLDNTVAGWFNDDEKLMTFYFRGDDGQGVIEKLYPIARDMVKLCYRHNATLSEAAPQIPKEENFARYDGPVIQTWVSDPFSRGSYSSFGVGLNHLIDEKIQYKGISFRAIFTPVSDRLFFIGEHTSIIYEVGTMEAAVESGERLARLFS